MVLTTKYPYAGVSVLADPSGHCPEIHKSYKRAWCLKRMLHRLEMFENVQELIYPSS